MKVYKGERGGLYYLLNGRKVYISQGPIVIKHAGSLSKYGYSVHASTSQRRKALREASHAYGVGEVIRKVNALYVFNEHKHPALAEIYAKDKKYLHSML